MCPYEGHGVGISDHERSDEQAVDLRLSEKHLFDYAHIMISHK